MFILSNRPSEKNPAMGYREQVSLRKRNVEDVWVRVSSTCIKQGKNYPKYSFGEFFSFEILSSDQRHVCAKTELCSPNVLVQEKSNVLSLVLVSNYRRHFT